MYFSIHMTRSFVNHRLILIANPISPMKVEVFWTTSTARVVLADVDGVESVPEAVLTDQICIA